MRVRKKEEKKKEKKKSRKKKGKRERQREEVLSITADSSRQRKNGDRVRDKVRRKRMTIDCD